MAKGDGWRVLNKVLRFVGRRPPARTPISNLKVGAVQSVEGEAIALGKPFPSPFSATPCATVSVFHRHDQGKTFNESRALVDEHVFGGRFYVRDETGLVRVDRDARSEIFAYTLKAKKIPEAVRKENFEHFLQFFDDHPTLAEFQKAMRPKFIPDGSKTLRLTSRYSERCVAHGSRVRVVGLVRQSGDPIPGDAVVGFRDAPTMLELVPPNRTKLRITRIKH